MTKKTTIKANEPLGAVAAATDRHAFPEIPDPRPVTSILVRIASDGMPSVDSNPAVVVPGGTVAWHTSDGEQRPFRILFEAGSPIGAGQDQAGSSHAEKTRPEKNAGEQGAAASDAEMLRIGAVLPSRTEQVVRAEVLRDAQEMMWTCIVETGFDAPKGLQRLLSGIIVRPPKRPG